MGYFTMSKMALKWAFSKPATTRYPFEPRKMIAGSRGQLVFDKATCVYCGVCVKKCPTSALQVIRAEKKWIIDRLRCINCNACVEVCPKKSLSMEEKHSAPTVTREREIY
jgi:formate hydrogenlyase subunit 6/NADH:ubiquinone oxidoreductase subunit I